jgi:hypothetical protein
VQGDVVLFVSQEAQSDDDLMQRLRYLLPPHCIRVCAAMRVPWCVWAVQLHSTDELCVLAHRFYNVTTVVVSSKFPYFEKGSLPHLMVERLLFPPMPELKAMNRR